MYILEKLILQLLVIITPVVFQHNKTLAIYLVGGAATVLAIIGVTREVIIRRKLYLKMRHKEDLDVEIYHVLGKYQEAPIRDKEHRDNTLKDLYADSECKEFKKIESFRSLMFITALLISLIEVYYVISYMKSYMIQLPIMYCGVVLTLIQIACGEHVVNYSRDMRRKSFATLRAIGSDMGKFRKVGKVDMSDGHMYASTGGDTYLVKVGTIQIGERDNTHPVHK